MLAIFKLQMSATRHIGTGTISRLGEQKLVKNKTNDNHIQNIHLRYAICIFEKTLGRFQDIVLKVTVQSVRLVFTARCTSAKRGIEIA